MYDTAVLREEVGLLEVSELQVETIRVTNRSVMFFIFMLSDIKKIGHPRHVTSVFIRATSPNEKNLRL